MLESHLHSDNSFVTLTYAPENLVYSESTTLSTLVPKHPQDWLKRFRKSIEPLKIRYYLVGEYGDETQRPHYHVALFGHPTCLRGRTLRNPADRTQRPLWQQCCPVCHLVGNTWTHGDVDLGTLATDSAQYLAGYVTKKMTSKHDDRLYGRHPEFARMSLKPGIGADFMHEVASTLMQFNLEESEDDVPSSLRHGNRIMPLGRYLRGHLRTLVGKEKNAPQSTLDAIKNELQDLRLAARSDNANPSFKRKIIEAGDQKVRQIEAKLKIHKKGKPL